MMVEIAFGALAQPLDVQLAAQGLKAHASAVRHIERDRYAVARLRVRGVLSDAEATKAQRRIMKAIVAAIRPHRHTGERK